MKRTGIIFTTAPSLIMLGLYYSLAMHMHHTLGAWPTSIGESGFPPALATHAKIEGWYFQALFIGSILIVPILAAICAIGSFNKILPYLVTNLLSFVLCCLLMTLAPGPFKTWWID